MALNIGNFTKKFDKLGEFQEKQLTIGIFGTNYCLSGILENDKLKLREFSGTTVDNREFSASYWEFSG